MVEKNVLEYLKMKQEGVSIVVKGKWLKPANDNYFVNPRKF
jgi:hypothetical protein